MIVFIMLITLFNMKLLSLKLGEKVYKFSLFVCSLKDDGNDYIEYCYVLGSKDHVTFYGL